MKKNLFIMALLAAFAATGCSEADNYAGGDKPEPVVTIYDNEDAKTYQVGFRAVPNTGVDAVYILTETTYARQEAIATNGEAAYLQYVRENGTVFEGQEPIDYLANPDNNSTSDKEYDASDDLLGYITTTIVVDGKGKTNAYTIEKSCYSTTLSLTNLKNQKTGDWMSVATVTIIENIFKADGNVGIDYLLQIPNTDVYCIPAVWYFVMGQDYDFNGSDNLIFKWDGANAVSLVSTSVMTGFDDQANGEWGFGYDGDPDYCSFTVENKGFTLLGYKLYGEEKVMVGEGEEAKPVVGGFKWVINPTE